MAIVNLIFNKTEWNNCFMTISSNSNRFNFTKRPEFISVLQNNWKLFQFYETTHWLGQLPYKVI